jgi:hypothetical protein
MFKRYQHIERFGNSGVDGIEIGKVYLFPKLDGTNGCVWFDDHIRTASRRKEITPASDNQGFSKYVFDNLQDQFTEVFNAHPQWRVFGEWLVPHTLKTYRPEAWQKFYVFDVAVDKGEALEYLSWEVYGTLLHDIGLDVIPPLVVITNGSQTDFTRHLDHNNYLIQDRQGAGEGIVLKNYDFYNKYGRQNWAKLVRSEFKAEHTFVMGVPGTEKHPVESDIAQNIALKSIAEKEFARLQNFGFESSQIPKLLSTIWYNFFHEELWDEVKKRKHPTINMKLLQKLVYNQSKRYLPEVF